MSDKLIDLKCEASQVHMCHITIIVIIIIYKKVKQEQSYERSRGIEVRN